MKIDTAVKKIMKEKMNKPTKTRVTLYLDKEVYQQFKKACGKTPASNVIESFMKESLK